MTNLTNPDNIFTKAKPTRFIATHPICSLAAGDEVVKDAASWEPGEFNSWGAGVGVVKAWANIGWRDRVEPPGIMMNDHRFDRLLVERAVEAFGQSYECMAKEQIGIYKL